ncbi:MAG: site-specific integrase [Tolumonas sp.]|nr:site-specific integrase [uncultured Tolumonas sp.]MDD2341369.1 site-specific integrase [Tolumonas sp.]
MTNEKYQPTTLAEAIDFKLTLMASSNNQRITIDKDSGKLRGMKEFHFRRRVRDLHPRAFGEIKFAELTQSNIDLFIADLTTIRHYANSTVNQYLGFLRDIMQRAYNDGVIAHDFMANKRNLPRDDESIADPFTVNEIQRLLSKKEQYPVETALIQLNICTGLRLSELFAISREHINLIEKTLTVQYAVVEKAYKIPKTKCSKRTIPLNQQAIEAIQVLMAHTEKRSATSLLIDSNDRSKPRKVALHLLALNTQTKQFYVDDQDFRDRFFKQHCQECGVRYRPPSQLRHTYASQMITAGMPIAMIARNMGHVDVEMVTKRYAKIIDQNISPAHVKRCDDIFFEMTQPVGYVTPKPSHKHNELDEEEQALVRQYRQMNVKAQKNGLRVTLTFM